ncbi:TOMM precursor leader peptide-binding protein [Pyxidicoccus sp. MSG2]|uniref:TOMM precursor leader peptide-binding protein n=1 Tax=Pyxidicoccus sp. MSG2 TaxID=2996790 RepID=UPI00226E6AF9|nr:TOMM precursor leader peptide-binding protein [Pyxidicoccus sp. MSG2]MCY1014466.1 TOMM precursor leader peptide-binding protein [Pyxidicoccus sp. MSG2]
MLKKPKLKGSYRVEPLDPETVVLVAEDRHLLLRGRLYAWVVPMLDGRRTVEELFHELEGQATAAEVLYVLGLLERKGLVAEAPALMAPAVHAFWDATEAGASVAEQRLRELAVSVSPVGGACTEALHEALAAAAVRIAEPAALSLLVTDDYLRGELEAFNRAALASRRPWMPVKLVGTHAWLGPLFRPGETGCWECLAQRLRGNRTAETTLLRQRGARAPLDVPRGVLPVGERAAANLAALEVAKWLVLGRSPRLEGKALTVDLLGLELREHVLVRRPQCHACGDPAPREPRPLVLQSRPKLFTSDGGFREQSPEQTLATYERHVSPLSGAVRALVRLSRSDVPQVHVYSSGPNLALRCDDLRHLRANLRNQSGGKAKTDAQARASALCEALERYSGAFHGDEPRRRARLRNLGEAAIHPGTLLGYSAAQYERRQDWNRLPWAFYERVPEPFDESAEIDWAPVWSLTRQELRYVPALHCYYGYPCPPGQGFCFSDSNGCAAGNSPEEATLQGFLEIVERDAVSIWWYNRLVRPRVALEGFGESYLPQLEAAYRANGRELWVLDVTADLGIPTFVAVSRRMQGPEQLVYGFGAHLDARLGILRAVTEANQFLTAVEGLTRSAAGGDLVDDATRAWLDTATLANQAHLNFDPRAPALTAADYPCVQTDNLAEDVRRCVAVAERHGLETLVLDQTRPDIGLPVVKVIIPGMRHFWRRLAPGRLYDVPVAMGWLPASLREEQLNPLTIFF